METLTNRYKDYSEAIKIMTKSEEYKNLPLTLKIVMRIACFGVLIGI